MSISGWARSAEAWIMQHVPGADWLVLFGAVMAVVTAGLIVVWLIRVMVTTFGIVSNEGKARAARRRNEPGFRILISPPAEDRTAGKWLESALSRYLPTFAFGAPFSLVRMGVIKGGLEGRSIARARKRMATADADMFLWASLTGKGERGFELHGLSRGGGLSPAEARLFTLALPGDRKLRDEDLARAAAYLLTKQLQPALSDPQAFRVEKIGDLARELDSLLAGEPAISSTLRGEIEADFCAAGVRVAEELGDVSVLDKVIALRRQHLDAASQAADTGRVLQARLDLGRALIVRAEKQFDQNVVREAIAQLSLAVEGLRADPTILRAQSASDALFKAQSMIESRKRFALNFGA